MIIGIGCDLCEIARFEVRVKEESFLERILTEREIAALKGSDARRQEHVAGLFAAKEAVAKALGTGFSGFGMKNIEILSDENGKPRAFLHGGALERLSALGGDSEALHVSISHDGKMAMAFAIAESRT